MALSPPRRVPGRYSSTYALSITAICHPNSTPLANAWGHTAPPGHLMMITLQNLIETLPLYHLYQGKIRSPARPLAHKRKHTTHVVPAYILRDKAGDVKIILRDGHQILPVYTRQAFAELVAEENEHIVECSALKLHKVINSLGNKGAIEMVGFNFGVDSLSSARPWNDFAQGIASSGF